MVVIILYTIQLIVYDCIVMLLCFYFRFFKLIFIGVWLLYNVVLASTAQQNESAIHTQISPTLDF